MDNTVKLRSHLQTTNTPEFGHDRKSKVDIKGICKKFESLSNVSESNATETSSPIPVAPIRRKRFSNNADYNNSSKISDNFKTESTNINNPAPKNSARTSLVKQKSLLFESPDLINKSVFGTSRAKLAKENNDSFSRIQSRYSPGYQDANKNDKIDAMKTNAPPVKPPRIFLHSNLTTVNSFKDSFETPRKTSLVDNIEKQNFNSEFKSRSDSSHSSFDNTNEDHGNERYRLGSAPEILTANTQKVLQSQRNVVKIPGKGFLSYLKNISNTANTICEKVKHSNIFVDLTPTTVSPPKHYGTLKRSMSEEHIYAEPTPVNKSDSSNTQSPPVDSLHYMCTSVIPPALPVRDEIDESKPVSKVSVRNMIYSSFAGVRSTPTENPENTPNSAVIDNSEPDFSMKAIQDRIIYVKSVRKQISSSSICLAPKLYEALFIINIHENQPEVVHKFPLKIDPDYNIPLLPHICFPDNSLWKSVSVYQSEVFNFTLIDKNETVYGYCLRIQGWPETGLNNEPLCVKLPVAICILSNFNAPVFYRKILFEIEKHLTLPRNSCFKYIRSLRKLGVPNAGASLSIPDCTEIDDDTQRIVISRPLDSHFVGLEMTRALQLLDVDILVKSVASLFLERRILLFSASVSNLYHCCKAMSSLLYPFEWPHQIIPVLPACLTIHCCSDQPYILGIVKNNCDSVLELLAEHELLIIDVDKGIIIKSCNDEDTILPKKVQKAVISALNLAKNMTDPTEMMRDIMISEAFVHMSVEMIGHYENHFTEVNGDMTFQKESFLKNACSHNIRSFLQWFSETQMFYSFIENSLWRMKYRNICQSSLKTFFEKRAEEYKWELGHDSEKLSRFIGKTVKNFGGMLKGLKKC